MNTYWLHKSTLDTEISTLYPSYFLEKRKKVLLLQK
uniref:Uncharacterized protein n=1 Tax=Arundo donax TaxID=35708 RepID=A0A0A9FTN0_ARUDO